MTDNTEYVGDITMKILFLGDSVTEAGRIRENPFDLGRGYAKFASELIKNSRPDCEFEFYNRGIGGNRSGDLLARLDTDGIALCPDVVSVLVGINDSLSAVKGDGGSDEEFFNNYESILSRLKKETSAKIIMMEQFVLPFDDTLCYHPDIDSKIQLTRKLAREFADVYVPLDGIVASACVKYDIHELSSDGIHPREALHRIIAEHYFEAFKSLQL